MKKELLETLPFDAIKELIDVREYFKQVSNGTTASLTQRTFDNDSVVYEFIDNISGYAFVLRDVKCDDKTGKLSYEIYRRPASLQSMTGSATRIPFAKIKENFSRWYDDVRTMNRVKHEYLNPDSQFYDEQFQEFFSNDDEDALTNPFEIDRQEIIFYFLTYAENRLVGADNLPDETKHELLGEISNLKESIPKVTKKKFVALLSKFAEKTKKASNKLFHDVFDVLKKELIKKVLYEGSAQIPNAVAKVEQWIHLLN